MFCWGWPFSPLQTSSNLFKPLQTSSNLFKPLQTSSNRHGAIGTTVVHQLGIWTLEHRRCRGGIDVIRRRHLRPCDVHPADAPQKDAAYDHQMAAATTLPACANL